MLSLPKDANEMMVLRTSFALYYMKKVKSDPQVSTNQNTAKYLNNMSLHKNSKKWQNKQNGATSWMLKAIKK
jgi:uncharacterized ion transporter superfamily protein YfcC